MTQRARRTYHHGNAAEALLAAAEALIEDKGVAAFSLREAAREVGIDPAACYRHFSSRDELLHAIGRRGFTRLAARMESALVRRQPPERALRALGRAYVEHARERPAEFRVMFGPNGVGARSPSLRGDYPRGPFDITLDTVRAWRGGAQARKRTGKRIDKDDETVTMALWAAVHGVASLIIDGAWRVDERTADRVLDYTLDRLLADASVTDRAPAPRRRSPSDPRAVARRGSGDR